jgi:ATP-dependent protease HslVU (ClpYQ) peptidase subunit
VDAVTTIAANLEVMVADSKVTVEHKGITYPATKIVRAGSRIVGASGHGGDCTRFLEWARKDFKGAAPKWHEPQGSEDSVLGLVLDSDGIYIYSPGDPEPEKVNAEFFAVGSGGKAARAAMKLGLDPVKAVELACEVDDFYSGLPIQVLRLKE